MNKMLLAVILLISCGKNQTTTKARKMPLTEAVYASGYVEPKNAFKLYSMADGYIDKIVKYEGNEVEPNEAIMLINSETASARLNASKDQLQLAEIKKSENSPYLNDLQHTLRNIQLKYQLDSLQLKRFAELLKRDAISQADYDKMKLQSESSRNDFLSFKEKYRLAKMQSNAEYSQANANKVQAKLDLSYYKVSAPVKSVIFELYKQTGELVRKGEPLAYLGSGNHWVVELTIDEEDISKVKLDQKVVIASDALKGVTLTGKVVKIYPYERKSDQTFRVDAVFDSQHNNIWAGMSVEANIIIKEIESAFVLPASLLMNDSVWVANGSNKEKRAVKTGARNFEWVEILDGISENDEIVKP